MALATQALEALTGAIERTVRGMTRILVIQTAFAGDLILTLPLIDTLHRSLSAAVDVLCIPSTAPLLENHPSIRERIVYDKRGKRPRLKDVAWLVRDRAYDVCISPHRSLRSALIARATGAKQRITFSTSTGSWLYTHRVSYQNDAHEVERNLALLQPLGIPSPESPILELFPGEKQQQAATEFLRSNLNDPSFVCIAPGSVWATKRWVPDGFVDTAQALLREHSVVLVGGSEDRDLCDGIATRVSDPRCVSAAGLLSFPSTAALIGLASLLISNDSAPVHIASAMGTPVVEIFGATSPAFGFTPYRVPSEIVQLEGLECKPCAIHGGHACPLQTFDCMKRLPSERVIEAAYRLLR